MEAFVVLGRSKRMIAGWTTSAALLAVIVSLLLPKAFTGIVPHPPAAAGTEHAPQCSLASWGAAWGRWREVRWG